MIESLAIAYESENLLAKAKELAATLDLAIDNSADKKIVVTKTQLVLKIRSFSPLFADFSITTWQKRRNEGKKQGLVRACKPVSGLKILDTTAGWGRDAAILSSFGAEVLMLERQPFMAVLLEDALNHQDELSKNNLKLRLCQIDAKLYLQKLTAQDYPDVIYIDPMHPERQKTALVKKDMQALQQIIGADEDSLGLLELALPKALKRVVVKWPQQLPPLIKPSITIPGKTVRYDIYLSN